MIDYTVILYKLLLYWSLFASKLRIWCAYFARITPISRASSRRGGGGGGEWVRFLFPLYISIVQWFFLGFF